MAQDMPEKLRLIADCIEQGKDIQYRSMGSVWMDKPVSYHGKVTVYKNSGYRAKPDKPRTVNAEDISCPWVGHNKYCELTPEVLQALKDAGIEV